MSVWVLPDHIADVLPSEARHIEELRRGLLDTARSYGYELVMPPMLEHLDSLLTGAGKALELQTFTLVDQLSGRSLGLRADTTQQVARIDAHLLNRRGVSRLCYCGPVLHTRPDKPHVTREPLQFGAEIYGHSGMEADVESALLALQCLVVAKVDGVSVDLADVRVLRCLLAGTQLEALSVQRIQDALAAKDASELKLLTACLPRETSRKLGSLLHLYGDIEILDEAQKLLGDVPGVTQVLVDLRALAARLLPAQVTVDLADLGGYAYYSGARFAMYAPGASSALVRGGRYDEVGAAFGRNRPAAGFSLDIKQLVRVVALPSLKAAIRAPWGGGHGADVAIAALRQRGETVVCALPGHESEVDEFHCDRELREVDGQWTVRSL